ncbi:hypothetical protein [uncultured Draconibacterium sp.]|uniref:hypothetical protein n=1 Tax=uncultured Draconibacterium sp. TaxID=1573823 RepID=UPI0032177D35
MKKIFILTGIFIAINLYSFLGSAQTYTLKIEANEQPAQKVILGTVSGDNFTPCDSILPKNEVLIFTFPENSQTGMYRVIFGQTPYARIMNEAPQQLDFIFNRENIELKTNFKTPLKSIEVVQSEENKLWFAFLMYDDEYRKQFTVLEKEMDYLWTQKDTLNALEKSNEFNRLQMARDLFIGQNAQQNNTLLAAELISVFREPVVDGYLNPTERKNFFQTEFFNTSDFSNERIVNTSVYTDKIFQYLLTFNQPGLTQTERETAYKKAVDTILDHTNKNEKVYAFICAYLIHGFDVLQMQNLVNYIHSKAE